MIPRRRAALAAAAVLTVAAVPSLAGCAPAGRAVGDTRTKTPTVAHVGTPRDDVTIALIGSKGATADRTVLDALADADLKAVYVSAKDAKDPDEAMRRGVLDMTDRVVDLIVISDLDTTADGVDAAGWDTALGAAREAGIPVALLDPVHALADDTLYAASLTINDRAADAISIDAAAMTIIDDETHARDIMVRTTK